MVEPVPQSPGVRVRAVQCPPSLRDIMRLFIAEEATSAMRHDLRNRLAALKNAAFYIRKRLEGDPSIKSDQRLVQCLSVIDTEAGALADSAGSRLPTTSEIHPAVANPMEVADRIVHSLQWPQAVRVTLGADRGRSVRVGPLELELALFCILENAVEATEGARDRAIEINWVEEGGLMGVLVKDTGPGFGGVTALQALQGFYTTKAHRLGAGLKIAKRVATRWGGKLDLPTTERGAGAQVTLLFRPS